MKHAIIGQRAERFLNWMSTKIVELSRGLSALYGQKKSSLSLKTTIVFIAVVISDFVWAKYMAAVATGSAVAAANWAVLVIAIGAYLVISYVEDKRLVLPAAIGAWIGTYLAI